MNQTVLASSTITAFLDGVDDPLAIANKIHSTAGARQLGYKAPLVGGVTLYSWCCADILKVLGEEWLDFGWADISFLRPVFPGIYW